MTKDQVESIKWDLPPARKRGDKASAKPDEAVDEAAEVFRDLFWGPTRFSPATPEDLSSMIAAVLTALVKTEVGAAPGWVVSEPIWGSSKGKFVDVVSIVRCGRRAPVMTFPTNSRGQADEAKLEDQLFAALLDGGGMVVVDEVQRQLQSTTLRSLITAEEYTARVKGVSKMATVRPVDSQWFVLGNNLTVAADDSRRWLRVYLDPRTDAPHKRVFDRDCLDHARENRRRIVWAALTILTSYLAAGAPDQGVRLGSFERWAALVPSALVWAGFANPLDTMEAWQDADPDRQRLGALLALWRAYFDDAAVTAKAACVEIGGGVVPADRKGSQADREALAAVLEDICSDGKRLSSRLLGIFLAQRVERRIGPLRFCKDGTYQGAVKWRVVAS
jgi:hypothetical protein